MRFWNTAFAIIGISIFLVFFFLGMALMDWSVKLSRFVGFGVFFLGFVAHFFGGAFLIAGVSLFNQERK